MTQNTFLPDPLNISNLYKKLGNKAIIKNINFKVSEGEFVVLLGPNGAGKTTLFQILSGLFIADSGKADIFGFDINKNPIEALKKLSIVFQQPALDLDLTVYSNLLFQTDLHGINRSLAKEKIKYFLKRFSLFDQAKKNCRILSGGTRRKVELIRALLSDPQLLLMDEATVGIDPESRSDILTEVKNLCKEKKIGVLWATHLIDEAEDASKILVMSSGSIHFDGSPIDFLKTSNQNNINSAFINLINSIGKNET